MHSGDDTEYYLKKGFRVVAIEANPDLVQKTQKRLAASIHAGQLEIIDAAISSYDGETTFYQNVNKDDWGTTSPEFARATEQAGTTHKLFTVRCMRFERILERVGVPYYLKIDIEGSDVLCLQALQQFARRPRYVSIEAGGKFPEAFTQISLFWVLGYRQFKIVNQAVNGLIRCPNPPLEGAYVNHKFSDFSSGPFGEETPGHWMNIEEHLDKLRAILRQQAFINSGKTRIQKLFLRAYNRARRSAGFDPIGWYDIHARYPDEV